MSARDELLTPIRDRVAAYKIWDATSAHAPSDCIRLLSTLDSVLALADQWYARGEHDMAFSKTIQDEDIATALLMDGATMVENARHIRNALTTGLTSSECGHCASCGHYLVNPAPVTCKNDKGHAALVLAAAVKEEQA